GVLAVLFALAYAAERHARPAMGMAVIAVVETVLLLSPVAGTVVEALYRNWLHGANLVSLVVVLGLAGRVADPPRRRDLRWIALAAALATWRAPLFAGISQYSAFFMPVSMVALGWLWSEGVPSFFTRLDPSAWRRAVLAVVVIWAMLTGVLKAKIFRG